ncbi:MAG: triphosphoribosyl-dephospho-CoA synthetase [Planctomycetes bacterium]|nr:triphosphoribosyl-dephospho-CoA synthetase [Planctomycetota bacterium]
MVQSHFAFGHHVTAAAATIPTDLRPWGPGWCAALAGILEAAAAKPGNVHPAASFTDLAFADLVAAAVAISAPLDAAPDRPLGDTILAAVMAAGRVTPSNANLGIVLLVAPLAAVPGTPDADLVIGPGDVAEVLAATGPTDAALIWQAIALARPGGLGRSDRWDVTGPPPRDIRAAMRHAADRDTIARLWADGYDELFEGPVADITTRVTTGDSLERSLVRAHLRQLARRPDSLIGRRHGEAAAQEVSDRAADLVAGESAPDWADRVAAFDAWLRGPRRLNPGTTADLIAAALYILLRGGRLRGVLPLTAPRPPTPPPRP